MKRIGEGRTAEIFEHSHERVLKLYRIGFPNDAIMYEYEINKLVATLGIPAPEVYGLVEFEERVGIIFQYIEGISLIQKIVQNPLELNYITEMLAEMHFQIHKHEINTDLGMHIRKQKEVLTQNIHHATQLSNDEKNSIIHYLEKLPNGNCLCHGDFHPDNAMVGEQKWIIDWMTAMIGNPAGDIARTLLLFRFGTLPEGTPSHIKEALTPLMRNKMGEEYIKHYLSYSNLLIDDIDLWTLPIAAARLTEWIPAEEKDALISFIRERFKQVFRDF
jgi:uncharacterized protein (TIGR02172 family)